MPHFICEYIWMDGMGGLRSKTRIIYNANTYSDIPEWNYDGSSTGQADAEGNTEVILNPVAFYKNPLRFGILVLCETLDTNSCPLYSNHRRNADEIFSQNTDLLPWFGIEQEYVIVFPGDGDISNRSGRHYCGVNTNNLERAVVEEHLQMCLDAELIVSGINAEVATRQWEFQIGPAVGIDAGDQICIARFLLERVAEKHGARINYFPKLCATANGSGCHINFSTQPMREPGGLDIIEACMPKLAAKHRKHIAVYGSNNELRLTGKHETSSMGAFSYGYGTRNTSVRIPSQTVASKCGYFEDRRPAANVEIYGATAMLFQTCCLESS